MNIYLLSCGSGAVNKIAAVPELEIMVPAFLSVPLAITSYSIVAANYPYSSPTSLFPLAARRCLQRRLVQIDYKTLMSESLSAVDCRAVWVTALATHFRHNSTFFFASQREHRSTTC